MLIKSEHNGHILEHDDEQHIYMLDGTLLDGVTTIISNGYPKSQRIYDWQTKEGAKWAIATWDNLDSSVKNDKSLEEIIKASPKAHKVALDEACDIGTLVHRYAYEVEAGEAVTHPEDLSKDDLVIYNKCCEQFDEWKAANDDEIMSLEELSLESFI